MNDGNNNNHPPHKYNYYINIKGKININIKGKSGPNISSSVKNSAAENRESLRCNEQNLRQKNNLFHQVREIVVNCPISIAISPQDSKAILVNKLSEKWLLTRKCS